MYAHNGLWNGLARHKRRVSWLGAVSLFGLLGSAAYAAPSTISGGGATQEQYVYTSEMSLYNSGNPSSAQWGTYWGSGSSAGQAALLNDDLTCDINKVTGANGGKCTGGSGVGQAGNSVDYGASDALLTQTQISAWQTYLYGQEAAGNLIQIPLMGVGIAVPVQNEAATTNGALVITDADLCGIFSGKITEWSQVALGKGSVVPVSGVITVVVRADGSGATYLFTNHLAGVCTASTSNITFTATTTFANLFGGTLPGNFVGETGSAGEAGALEALSSAIGYVTPDFTSLDTSSGQTVNGAPSTLVDAAIVNGKLGYLPTTKNITTALARPKIGQTLTPPVTAAEGAVPSNWVPSIEVASAGYSIVGYSVWDLAQCYADKTVGSAIVNFLNDSYTNTSYLSVQSNNGFVTIANSGGSKFLNAVRQHILTNGKGNWQTDIDDATACKAIAGR